MAVTDFLSEGAEIPAGSALTSVATQQTAPEWYTDYLQNIVAQQTAQGGAAYSPYSGPRVAPFTPDQINSFQQTRDAAGSAQPGLATAANTAAQAAGTSGAAAAAPGMATAGNTLAGALTQPTAGQASSPFLQTAGGNIQGGINAQGGSEAAQGYLGAASGAVNQGLNAQTGAQAGAGYLGDASGTLQQGINATTGAQAGAGNLQGGAAAINAGIGQSGGLDAAQGFLNNASGTVENVDSYMNPYNDAVVNRIGELGNRNLMEKIMPGLEGRYIKAGQFRGSGQMTDTARAVRDTQEGISAAQSAALQSGYTNAQTAKGTDLSRQGTLASTAGNLGAQDRTTSVQGGTALANVGQAEGNLAATDRNTTVNAGQAQGQLGQTAGTLAENARATDVNAGQTLGQLGSTAGNLAETGRSNTIQGGSAMGNLGQTAASAANQDRATTADIGQAQGTLANQQGQLAGQDAQNLNQAANTQGNLATATQTAGLQGASAVNAAGGQQQALDQQNMQVGYEEHLRQQGYNQEQINNMVNTAKGIQPGVPLQGVREGIEPGGVVQPNSPSTASTIAGTIATGAGVINDIWGKKP